MLNDFIREICNILDINVPAVSFDTSHFQSKTTHAQCAQDGKTIYLRKSENLDFDLLFEVAHELRHVWQIQNDKELYFSTYKPVNLLSTDEYNLQFAEIDANAFGGIVMISYFHVRPLFQGLSDAVKAKIYDRMEYLKTTELCE